MLSHFSYVQLLAIPWTVAHQAPLSLGFFRQEHWSGLPFPSPGDLPNPAIEPKSSTLQILYCLIHHGCPLDFRIHFKAMVIKTI